MKDVKDLTVQGLKHWALKTSHSLNVQPAGQRKFDLVDRYTELKEELQAKLEMKFSSKKNYNK